jgi:hypothetical protein
MTCTSLSANKNGLSALTFSEHAIADTTPEAVGMIGFRRHARACGFLWNRNVLPAVASEERQSTLSARSVDSHVGRICTRRMRLDRTKHM